MTYVPPHAPGVESATRKAELGTKYVDIEGKTWRYCRANEALAANTAVTQVNLFDGDCDASSGSVLNDAAVTFTSAAVGMYVKINAGTNSIDDAPNLVKALVTANQLKVTTAWSADLTTSEDYVVYHNYNVEATDAASESIVGVTPIAITSGYYFWLQTEGLAHVEGVGNTDAIVQYEGVVSSSTAGAVKGLTAAGTTVDEAEKANMTALVPTALASQKIPVMLKC